MNIHDAAGHWEISEPDRISPGLAADDFEIDDHERLGTFAEARSGQKGHCDAELASGSLVDIQPECSGRLGSGGIARLNSRMALGNSRLNPI